MYIQAQQVFSAETGIPGITDKNGYIYSKKYTVNRYTGHYRHKAGIFSKIYIQPKQV
jgi:hypothetical protein